MESRAAPEAWSAALHLSHQVPRRSLFRNERKQTPEPVHPNGNPAGLVYKMTSMSDVTARTRIESALRVVLGVSALLPVLLFFVSALGRLHYPYELEELEGYMVYSLQRVMGGQALYPAPNVHFLPYMYPPGYFYAASLVARLFHSGASFETLRLTSILATIGSLLVLFAFVWRECKRFLPGLIAVGLYASCYKASGAWFDLGRVDSLYILLLLLSLYATRFWPAPVAALFWLLTFTTKQSVLPIAFVALCFHFERRLRTLAGLAVLAIGAGSIVAIANRITSGWFSFYVFKVPRAGSYFVPRMALVYLPMDIFAPMGITCLVILAAFLLPRLDWRQPTIRFYLLTLLFVPLCGYIHMHIGAAPNTEMPVFAVFAMLGGLSFAWLEEWLHADMTDQASAQLRWLGSVILPCAMAVQLCTGLYGPHDYAQLGESKTNTEAVIREIQQMPGQVYLPTHPYYAVMAGKTGYADFISLFWVLPALDPVSRAQLEQQIGGILNDPQVSGVFLDNTGSMDQFDELLHLAPNWIDRFPVRTYVPGVASPARPSLLFSVCPLPESDYQLVSQPVAPPGCPTKP